MAELQRFPLMTTTGQKGHIYRRARFIDPSEQSRVVLEDGTELIAPSDAVEPQNDGSFLLHTRPPGDGVDASAPVDGDLPRARTTQSDHRTEPPGRTQQASAAPPAAAAAAEQLYAEDVGIDRVAVNQIVDEPPATRQEGDVTIIPVVEEVLVVQKRYMVKEEIRIQRQRHPVDQPRRIVLNGHEAEPQRRS